MNEYTTMPENENPNFLILILTEELNHVLAIIAIPVFSTRVNFKWIKIIM